MFSPWVDWLAYALVVGLIVSGNRNRGVLAVMLAGVLVISWIFGTAKLFLLPLALGGVIWILMGRMKNPWRWLGKCAAIGGTVGTVLLCWVFPVPESPPLIGQYQVGTLTLDLPAAANGSPRLLAQVWYPAGDIGEKPAVPWLPDRELASEFPYQRLAFAKAHARLDVPVADIHGLLPVIFYEHSWMGHRFENITQTESLAAEGFVVVAVDHPGQAERVLYPDGTVVNGRYAEPLDFSSAKSVATFTADAERCFTERLKNVERVRQALAGRAAKQLSDKLKLDHVGVFGFSFGGSTAIRLCAEDPAFVAGANEDGLFLGDQMPRGAFLFFDQEMPAWLEAAPKPEEDAGQILTRQAEARIQAALKQPDRDRLIIDGTRHLSFSDRIFASRFPRLARIGTRPPNEVHEIVSKRLAKFFKTELGATEKPE
ncbi:MAG: dienelactone hydrolase family protein [Luteolibacter sp.]